MCSRGKNSSQGCCIFTSKLTFCPKPSSLNSVVEGPMAGAELQAIMVVLAVEAKEDLTGEGSGFQLLMLHPKESPMAVLY